ncbi:MAG: hypothetical protein J5590_08420 [Clostridia bacterium]|nr:hypothetical protein [Clostridia bacterium]
MNKEMIVELVKKTGLSEDIINQAISFVESKLKGGEIDGVVEGLTSKLNIPDDAAKSIVDAVSGAVGSGILDEIKGIFKK